MTNALQVVMFHGDPIECVEQDGRLWVVLRRLYEMLGIDFSSQRTKLSDDEAVCMVEITTRDTLGREQAMSCIELDSLPYILARINTGKVRIDLRPRLLLYKREVVKVLRDHFLKRSTAARPVAAESVHAMPPGSFWQQLMELQRAQLEESRANREFNQRLMQRLIDRDTSPKQLNPANPPRPVLPASTTAPLLRTPAEWVADPATFGDILRERREMARLTRVELAALARVADSTIRNIEMGRHIATRFTIASLLGVKELGLGAPNVPPPAHARHEVAAPPTAAADDDFAREEIAKMKELAREPPRNAPPASPGPQLALLDVEPSAPVEMRLAEQDAKHYRLCQKAVALVRATLGKFATEEDFSAAFRRIYAEMKVRSGFDAEAKADALSRQMGRKVKPMDAIRACHQATMLMRVTTEWVAQEGRAGHA